MSMELRQKVEGDVCCWVDKDLRAYWAGCGASKQRFLGLIGPSF